AARRFPARPAMDFLGRQTGYGELAKLVEAAARGFQQLGVTRGDRVALCLPNTPYYVICYFAVLRAGGVVVNLNPLYVEKEMRHLVEDSGAVLLVTLDLAVIYKKILPLLDSTCLEKLVICPLADALPPLKKLAFSLFKRKELAEIPADARHMPFARLLEGKGAPVETVIDPLTDIAVLQYTGGTTGVPKAAMLTHANLTGNCDQIARLMPDMPVGTGSVLVQLPLFHVFAMTVAMNLAIQFAAEMILLPRYDRGMLRAAIKRKQPTMFPGVPTLYTNINEAAGKEKWALSSIRYCISGGAPLPMEVRQRFEALSGCQLVEGYGLSETSPVATCNPMGAVRDGSIGLPLPGTTIEIRDCDDPTKLMPPGEKGEVCVRGPQVMKGYWRRSDETANCFIDGSLRTGDVGYIDQDGYVFLVDRIKDLIIAGGYNVYPRVIEEALYQHPAIAEAVVIGVPDANKGQVPKAFVTLREGHSVTEQELHEFLAGHISPIERPRQIEFRDQLPKTLVGKLSKKELVAEELAKRAGAASAQQSTKVS
ncbi:MAG TPA: long-chain fatty acid--CoA ligase, partial [Magnetospirillaceae bacterium]|nr:long-chain fatty acid--CoA ligase [Magnetospirillaceae bacterium]